MVTVLAGRAAGGTLGEDMLGERQRLRSSRTNVFFESAIFCICARDTVMSIDIFGGGNRRQPDGGGSAFDQVSGPISGPVPKRPRSGTAPVTLSSAEEAAIAAAMRENTAGRDSIQRVTIPRLPKPVTQAAKKAQEPFWNKVVERLNVANEVSDGCIQEPLDMDCIANSDDDPTFRLNNYLYNRSNLAQLRQSGRDPMTRAAIPAAAWDVAFPAPAPARAAAPALAPLMDRILIPEAASTPAEARLINAAAAGHQALVANELGSGTNVHARNDLPLRTAALHGHREVVRMLLDEGANVHANHDEALRTAAQNGHPEVVAQLLAAGANVHEEALRRAQLHGHRAVVEQLLAAGAN